MNAPAEGVNVEGMDLLEFLYGPTAMHEISNGQWPERVYQYPCRADGALDFTKESVKNFYATLPTESEPSKSA